MQGRANHSGVIVFNNELAKKHANERIFLLKIEKKEKYIFFLSRMTSISQNDKRKKVIVII